MLPTKRNMINNRNSNNSTNNRHSTRKPYYNLKYNSREDVINNIYNMKKELRIRNLRYTMPNLQRVMPEENKNIISNSGNEQTLEYYKAFIINAKLLGTFSTDRIADKIINEISTNKKKIHPGMVGVKNIDVALNTETISKVKYYIDALSKLNNSSGIERTNNNEQNNSLVSDNLLLRKQRIAYDAVFNDIVQYYSKELPNLKFGLNIEKIYGPGGGSSIVSFIFPDDKNFREWNNLYNGGEEENCEFIDTIATDLKGYSKNSSKRYKLEKEAQVKKDKAQL